MSTIVSRLKLDHPSLNATGGSGLHTSIETIYTKIGDHGAGRYFTHSAIANSTTVTEDHNFGVALRELTVLIYTGSFSTFTRVPDPVTAGWTIAATSGLETTKIDVTTPSSGGPHTFAVMILQNGGVNWYYTDSTSDAAQPVTAAATATFGQVGALPLGIGRYLLQGSILLDRNGATLNSAEDWEAAISTTSASQSGSVLGYSKLTTSQTGAATANYSSLTFQAVLANPTSSTTYYLNALARYSAGSPRYWGYLRAFSL